MAQPCFTSNVKFQLRRDLAATWTSTNPILKLGEPGSETDTGQMKVGDGIRSWNALPYVGAGTGTGNGILDGGTPSSVYGTTPALIDAGGVV